METNTNTNGVTLKTAHEATEVPELDYAELERTYQLKCMTLGDLILKTNHIQAQVQYNNTLITNLVKELTDLNTKGIKAKAFAS